MGFEYLIQYGNSFLVVNDFVVHCHVLCSSIWTTEKYYSSLYRTLKLFINTLKIRTSSLTNHKEFLVGLIVARFCHTHQLLYYTMWIKESNTVNWGFRELEPAIKLYLFCWVLGELKEKKMYLDLAAGIFKLWIQEKIIFKETIY